MHNTVIGNQDISYFLKVLILELNTNETLRSSVSDLADRGENTIALEILCDCLVEDQTAIPYEHFVQIYLLGNYLKLDEKYYPLLRENVLISL